MATTTIYACAGKTSASTQWMQQWESKKHYATQSHANDTTKDQSHNTVKSNPNIVGHRQIHEQALVVNESAPRHFLQAVCGAVGQVGEGSKNALLHHVEGTVVRLLPTQQIPRLERPQFGELPNFHGLVSDGGLVNDRLEHLH